MGKATQSRGWALLGWALVGGAGLCGWLATSTLYGEPAAPAAKPAEVKPLAEKPPAGKPAADKTAADKAAAAKKKAADAAARAAQQKDLSAKFIRLSRDAKKEPLALETSIVRYVPADGTRAGLTVDLIGAVHVGDKKYYEDLNKKFDEYQVVLYELVAPPGAKIPKGGGDGGGGNPVRGLQTGLKGLLDLEFQLEQVDYTKSHFVHADMSPEQFAKSMKDRGESFMQMFFKLMAASMAQQAGKKNQPSDLDILIALMSSDRAFQMKRLMASQFEDLSVLTAFEGPDGSTLLSERNKVALEVLKKEIAGGRTKIAIFYGAGHYPDMHQRLVNDFKLQDQPPTWLEAWNLRAEAKKTRPAKKAG